jgi:energy-coupling factor transporter transmembrane protein EcfT
MRTIANTAGMVLVRAYERGLRVQDSLRMRGYAGEVRTLSDIRIRGRDAAFCIALAIVPGLGLCFQWGVLA